MFFIVEHQPCHALAIGMPIGIPFITNLIAQTHNTASLTLSSLTRQPKPYTIHGSSTPEFDWIAIGVMTAQSAK